MRKVNISYHFTCATGWDKIIDKVIGKYVLKEVKKNLGFPHAKIEIANSGLSVNRIPILKGYGGIRNGFYYIVTEIADSLSEEDVNSAINPVIRSLSRKNPGLITKGKSLLKII